jgi:phosphatidylserine/phosphatidylglycerophosphate/cardiolipin synthase-like enzyme
MKKMVFFLLLALSSCSSAEVYFCPKDNCQGQAVNALSGAKHSIYFMTYSFTDDKIADAIVKKSREIEVMGLMESQRVNSMDNKYFFLTENGVDVALDRNRAIMHNKVFVIDRKIVITGSYNPTKNGNENNNENMVIIRDRKIAEKYADEFFRLTA